MTILQQNADFNLWYVEMTNYDIYDSYVSWCHLLSDTHNGISISISKITFVVSWIVDIIIIAVFIFLSYFTKK